MKYIVYYSLQQTAVEIPTFAMHKYRSLYYCIRFYHVKTLPCFLSKFFGCFKPRKGRLYRPFSLVVLLKIFHGRFEHLHVVLARHVLIQSVSRSLSVSHLAEYASVRGCHTSNGKDWTVRIESDVVARISFEINILGCDLTVKLCKALGTPQLSRRDSAGVWNLPEQRAVSQKTGDCSLAPHNSNKASSS